jgi:hypothetical protein
MTSGGARICGDCWAIVRPTEYEPVHGGDAGSCDGCGLWAYTLHRVTWDEARQAEQAQPWNTAGTEHVAGR